MTKGLSIFSIAYAGVYMALGLFHYFHTKFGRRKYESARDRLLKEILALDLNNYESLKTQLDVALHNIHDWDVQAARYTNIIIFSLSIFALMAAVIIAVSTVK